MACAVWKMRRRLISRWSQHEDEEHKPEGKEDKLMLVSRPKLDGPELDS